MPALNSSPSSVRALLNHGPMSEDVALFCAVQIASGMAEAADRVPGLVHGDLKPENLLFQEKDLLISDFGLARISDDWSLELEGTWAYLSPESWDHGQPLSVAQDIYAFGVVLYEMVTNRKLD